MCYAFSLPPTAFTKQVNRATAETSQQSALDEGMAPLMGWVERLADHVIQDRLGEPELEFAWAEGRPADPAAEAKVIDTYVRNGVYAINEARDLLGLDPVPGGDRPMVYGTQGAVPLGVGGTAVAKGHRWNRDPSSRASVDNTCRACDTALRKYNPDWEAEPRIPPGQPGHGEWTTDGGGPGRTADSRGERKSRCIERCSYILERWLPTPGSQRNTWDFHRCVDECMKESEA